MKTAATVIIVLFFIAMTAISLLSVPTHKVDSVMQHEQVKQDVDSIEHSIRMSVLAR